MDPHSVSHYTNTKKPLFLGMAFTFVIAVAGYLLAFIPFFNVIGPLACSLLIAIVYRRWLGYPVKWAKGIQFTSKHFLRTAIVLFGLKLNINVVLHKGLGLLLMDAIVIVFSLGLLMLLAKWTKADRNLSFLLASGTAICGASAIATVASIVKAKDEDTAASVGLISIIGTLFAITYTLIRPFLTFDPASYGIWAGSSLHEVANVALAGAPAGSNGLAYALLAKLGRVFLLIPFSFVLIIWINRKNKGTSAKTIEFPWFLLGFVITSLIGTYLINHYFPVPPFLLKKVSFLTSFFLTMAMVGLGLNINLKRMKQKAIKPLVLLVITSILLSIGTYIAVLFLH